MTSKPHIQIYIDGASRGNPGMASLGVAVIGPGGKILQEISQPLGIQTNNVAEYMGLLYGLGEALKLSHRADVEILTDSELLAQQINGRYRVKNAALSLLYKLAKSMMAGQSITVRHIPREKNRRADQLANEALDLTIGRKNDLL